MDLHEHQRWNAESGENGFSEHDLRHLLAHLADERCTESGT